MKRPRPVGAFLHLELGTNCIVGRHAISHGALLKNEQDVHLFERSAFLSRREV
jgi:hypothetical protein